MSTDIISTENADMLGLLFKGGAMLIIGVTGSFATLLTSTVLSIVLDQESALVVGAGVGIYTMYHTKKQLCDDPTPAVQQASPDHSRKAQQKAFR